MFCQTSSEVCMANIFTTMYPKKNRNFLGKYNVLQIVEGNDKKPKIICKKVTNLRGLFFQFSFSLNTKYNLQVLRQMDVNIGG